MIKAVAAMKDGDVVLLENTRYRIEETKNGEAFSKELASLAMFMWMMLSVQLTEHIAPTSVSSVCEDSSCWLFDAEGNRFPWQCSQ